MDKAGYVLYGGLVSSKSPSSCRCGHPYAAHEHLRPGTECVTCPAGDCARYRPVRWWHRDPWTFFALRRGARGVLAEGVGPAVDQHVRPTADDRSLVALAPGEVVVAVRLPAAPEASAYLRAGERRAFSFPLVGVAAARRVDGTHLCASGVANVPLPLDPSDPLADLPGNPQTIWKRRVVTTLARRALEALA